MDSTFILFLSINVTLETLSQIHTHINYRLTDQKHHIFPSFYITLLSILLIVISLSKASCFDVSLKCIMTSIRILRKVGKRKADIDLPTRRELRGNDRIKINCPIYRLAKHDTTTTTAAANTTTVIITTITVTRRMQHNHNYNNGNDTGEIAISR